MDKLALLGGARAVPRGLRVLPWPAVTEDDRAAVLRVLDSGRFTAASSGEQEIESLEREWASRVGTRHCVAVSNGTAALSLAIAAAGLRPGEEVIVPALSFIASAVAALHVSAVPVFADIDPRTYNLDPDAVEAAVTPRTRAILVVHLHGLPADMDRITAVARRHRLAIIEDAAQAHGACYAGRAAGSLGDIAAFSLNVSKNLATCGEGGLITTDDDALARRALMMRQFGEIIPQHGERSYVSHLPGWNHKPNAIQAAFTRSQLDRFDADAKIRADNVRCLLGRVGALPGLVVPRAPAGWTHAWHILRFRVRPEPFGLDARHAGALRAALQRALRAEGVPLSQYQLMPLPGQRVFQPEPGSAQPAWWPPGVPPRRYRQQDYPNTLRVIEDSFTIQKAHLHPMARPLLDAYADAFEKVWRQGELIAQMARDMAYQPPWLHAERIAATEAVSA